MKEAEKNGTAAKSTEGLKLGMRISDRNAQEHCVRALQNGKEYCIYVNGNPRAAQALNGLTNPNIGKDSAIKSALESLKNGLAQLLTSKNPAISEEKVSDEDDIYYRSNVLFHFENIFNYDIAT